MIATKMIEVFSHEISVPVGGMTLVVFLMICDIKNMNRGDRKYGQCDDGWKITCDEIGNKNDFPGQNGLA